MTLGLARDGDAGFAVEPENLQGFLRLRAAKQLLKPRDIFEALFQRLRALVGVGWVRLTFHPTVLLLGIQELA